MTTALTSPTPTALVLRTRSGRRRRDRFARIVLIAAALTTFAVTVLIIATLAFDAWDFVRQITEAERGLGLAARCSSSPSPASPPRSPGGSPGFDAPRCCARLAGPVVFFVVASLGFTVVGAWRLLNRLATELTQAGWFPRRGLFDIGTLIVGTFIVAIVAMVVAVPLGLGAAIYLAEYANPRVRRVIKPIIEILAGIPSVVLAYFAIAFINPNIVVRLFNPPNEAFTMLAAGLAVGVLTIPIIASVAEDALRAVPLSLREASYGLGAEARPDDVPRRLPSRRSRASSPR